MDEQLIRSYARWHEAEAHGRDDEADAMFARVYESSMELPPVSPRFMFDTLEAVAAAAARDARRARRTRRVLVPVAAAAVAVLTYASAGFIAGALSGALVRFLDLMVGAVVSVATTMPAAPDAWTVLTSLGRAMATLITNPAVTATILAIQAFAIVALIALQRLLGSDRESFR